MYVWAIIKEEIRPFLLSKHGFGNGIGFKLNPKMKAAVLLVLCCVCWGQWASAETPGSRQLRQTSDITALCSGFRTICEFVVTNCNSDASAASGDCITSFELYYKDRVQLQQCETLAVEERDKQRVQIFLEKYEQWQRARVCAKFHATEKQAAHDCSGDNVHRPWNAETWPLFCHETFTAYKGMRKDLESLCPRTPYSDTFWEGYVDYIASPACKKYYDHVRAAATRKCDSQSEWSQEPCAGIFGWYLEHQKTVESECFELHRSKPFYKGFYGWKALRAP